jgi:uncharacterized protein
MEHNPTITAETLANNPAPVSAADRIKTIDIIRGVALLGILMMNITGFGIHWSVYPELRTGSQNTWDFITWSTREIYFSGTMRGLFSMLFGAGMILFTMNKKDVPNGTTVAEYYYRRLLWLVLFGVINAFVFLWWGDILYFYGLAGMVLYAFRKTSAKWLITLGLVAVFIGAFKNQLWYNEVRETRKHYKEAIALEKQKKPLSEEQKQAREEWPHFEPNKPDQLQVQDDVKQLQGNYASVFNYYLPRNGNFETWNMYEGIWDSLSMMFIGMGLFVLGFFSNKWKTSSYFLSMCIGYAIGIPIAYSMFFTGQLGQNNFGQYVDSYRVPHWVLYDTRRAFLAVGHASLIMLIFRSKVVPWLMKSLACVGQMAFTNYLMHSIICTLYFHGYGFGNFNKLSFHQLFYVVGAVWVFQMIFSVIWLKYFRFGPFEWLWRSLTYWKAQPMKVKSKPVTVASAGSVWKRETEEVSN